MTIEIHTAELEALIQRQMESGEFQSVDDLLHRAIDLLPLPAVEHPSKLTPAQRAEAFRRWADSHTGDVVLSDEAMTRASFYGERG